MKNTMFKRALSLFISFLMVFTIFPATVFTFASADVYPVMEAFDAASSTEFHAYYDSIYSATFLDSIDWDDINAADTVYSWDSSANNDNSVIAYMKLNTEQTALAGADRYDLYIAGDGGVGANPDSGLIFYFFSALEEVRGAENFKTANATTMYGMFYNCKKLRSITSINWDTSNVTDMAFMFRDCYELTELDLSSFDTSKVTTMRFMFYYCQKLEYIYVGDGWTTESIANLSDGVFNCCYAIMGGKEVYDEKFPYFAPGADYAKLVEDGGFLTYSQPQPKEYTVTYEFIGDDIPEGVSVVSPAKYEEGTTVTVVEPPETLGYIFSGWSTEDADISEGSFVINNDVKIVGSWEKLYNVYYKYEGEVPAGAPELSSYTFKAGDTVTVDKIPFVDGYVFVGWDTYDVAPSSGKFLMPQKDVTLYGYFKKPVDSVEINGEQITLNKDGETVINVTVKPEDATVKEIIFKSDNENVVKVDENGKITAVGEGTATVTVYSKDDPTKKDTITVTVKIPVTDIIVDKTEILLNKDTTDKITALIKPDDATNKEVTYSSADEKVAIVDKDGNLTAVGKGTTIITVASKDDTTLIQTVKVTVKIPVTKITASDDFTLNIREEKNIEASVNEDATNKELIYESSNLGVIKVDKDGNVIAVGEGQATITVTSKDNPSIKETVVVTVKIPVENIDADKNEITLNVGEKDKVTVTVTPNDATYKEVEYESEDETVATVDKDGNITAVGKGTTIITVTSKDDPTNKDSIIVTVKDPDVYVPVSNITASDDFTLIIGEEKNVDAYVNDDATNKALSYSSSDNNIATVDNYGNVTAVGEGTVTITIISADNSDITESVVITVTEPEYVIEAPDSITIKENETANLGVKVIPAEGAPKITYVSADESIVKVDADGNIVGVGVGTTTITVDIGNGNIKVITVTVTAIPGFAPPLFPVKHHIAFGKTDGIGWYEVSVNGGDFFPQGPNSTLEIEKGSIIVVRVQDLWIDDDFTFYVNGKKVEKDAANCITLTVDGYMLIGALSMDVEVPDVEESLNLLQKIIKAIKAFFEMIVGWFK